MSPDEIDALPRASRLALAYAPKAWREDHAALLALDAQFARFVGEASEPIIAQMRLAWWRDRFAEPVSDWPKGNPLLARFSRWGEAAARLGGMVDGWEAMLGQHPLGETALRSFAEGRAAGWLALADSCGVQVDNADIVAAARRHAFVDAAWFWLEGEDRALALALAREMPTAGSFGKALKPLAVLDVLAERALAEGRAPLSRPADLLAALRRGLLGR